MELRKDYILDSWVIISSVRNARPKQFPDHPHDSAATDFFAPGNEHLTPPEIGRIPDGDSWKMRWFPNKFPFVSKEHFQDITTDNNFFTFGSAYGSHEVIAETPSADEQLWDLGKEDLVKLFKIYNERILELSKDPSTKYVAVFKNHGKQAGTSILHSHTQLASLNFIPKNIRDKCGAVRKHGKDVYGRIINIEKQSHRRCFENDSFVAFTPYASRFQYEIWIFPKEFTRTLDELGENRLADLADIMHTILNKLKEINAPFNYYLHYSPKGEDLHLHIEVTPRLSKWAGFEHSTGTIVNAISPEAAAKFYRGELE